MTAQREVMAALRAAAKAQRATAAALEALAEMMGSEPAEVAAPRVAPAVELLTVVQAARQIGMSASYVYRAIEEGRLPVARLGNRVRVRPKELGRFVARRELAASNLPMVSSMGQATSEEEDPSDNTHSATESPRSRPRSRRGSLAASRSDLRSAEGPFCARGEE